MYQEAVGICPECPGVQRILVDFQLQDRILTQEEWVLQLSHLVSQIRSVARSAGSEGGGKTSDP